MLTYFPTPYPGEWWYSALCRYHTRSGNAKQQTTIKELFPGRVTAAMGSVLPNSTIRQVASQLPPGVMDIRKIIQQHTLFPYFTRCYPIGRKEEVLERLCLGETIVITSIRRLSGLSEWKPRYCPQCVAEDRQNYGEAYWHMEHQIPLMTLCPQHGCRLRQAEEIPISHLKHAFFPLEGIAKETEENSEEFPDWELSLSHILHDYYALPLSASATLGYSNLALSLNNMGYGVIQKNSRNTILDTRRLYKDLTGFYGAALIEQIFGGEKSSCTINRVGKWEMAVPERYAVLQCFAGIDSGVVFSKEPIPEQYQERLLALKRTGVVYGKKQLAEKLGITRPQLDILAQKYGIEPFWTRNGERDEETGETGRRISFRLNKQELDAFKRALGESGFRYDSHFVKYCVMETIQRKNRKGEW